MSEILRWGAKVAAGRRAAVAEADAILTVLADTAIMSPAAKMTAHGIINGHHAPMFHLSGKLRPFEEIDVRIGGYTRHSADIKKF